MKAILTVTFAVFLCSFLNGQAYPDRHSTASQYAWTSCETKKSPNTARPNSHWIMYDLGADLELGKSTIWNNNTPGYTQNGIREALIDYSNDGRNWTELGQFEFLRGAGSTIYEGDAGPDFNGVNARYVLITGLSNYGGDCYSLSEIKIEMASSTVATNETASDATYFTITPNPASDIVKIQLDKLSLENAHYQLTDISGKVLKNGLLSSSIFKLNVRDLTSGAYTITVTNKQGTFSQIINVITQ